MVLSELILKMLCYYAMVLSKLILLFDLSFVLIFPHTITSWNSYLLSSHLRPSSLSSAIENFLPLDFLLLLLCRHFYNILNEN